MKSGQKTRKPLRRSAFRLPTFVLKVGADWAKNIKTRKFGESLYHFRFFTSVSTPCAGCFFYTPDSPATHTGCILARLFRGRGCPELSVIYYTKISHFHASLL